MTSRDANSPDPLGDYDPLPVAATGASEPGSADGSHGPSAALNPIEIAAERGVLAAVLAGQQMFGDVDVRLRPADFGVPAHRAIFGAILSCDSQGKAFDPVTVADELRIAGQLGRAGGQRYLDSLLADQPQMESLASYISIIEDRSLRRNMVSAAHTIGDAALNPTMTAVEVLDAAERSVFELSHGHGASAPSMSVVMRGVLDEMSVARTSTLVGHSSGIERLDKLTGGFRGGQLIVIGARPGMGKSVLALQLAREIAERSGLTVPFLSYEMSSSELGFRLLSSATGVELSKLLAGDIPTGMDRVVAEHVEKIAKLPLVLEDQPPLTISGARSYVRRLARRGRLGAVFVDYIQLQGGDGGRRDESRTQEVGTISRTWKLIAKELDVPVFAVSQLNRGLESRPNKRPLLSDLRESGSIEQDANQIYFLYRPYVYDKSAEESHAELIVAKNRQGPQGTIPLDWRGNCVRFDNTDREVLGADAGNGGDGGFGGGGFGGGGRSATRPGLPF